MASEMVPAYDLDGGQHMTPVDDVIEIPVLPCGPGGALTPACRRFLNRHDTGGVPTKLLQIKRPNVRIGRRFVVVRYECTPLMRETASGPVYRHEDGCQVCSLADVDDPLFAGLTCAERARIARAVTKVMTKAARSHEPG